MNPSPDSPQTPKKIKARGMGEILALVDHGFDDERLANAVREVAARVRVELQQYAESLKVL